MKRLKFIISSVLILTTTLINAQQYELGASVGVQMPTGELKDDELKTGFGFNLSARQFVSQNVKLGINLGISRFADETSSDYAVRITTVTGGIEYYLTNGKLKPFIGTDIGFYNDAWVNNAGGTKQVDKIMLFGLSPNIGVSYTATDNILLTGGFKYNYAFMPAEYPVTWWGVNVGIAFSLGK